MPRTLHLIKHGKPGTVPGVPAHDWELAEDALRYPPVSTAPRPRRVERGEGKAQATGQALAAALDTPFRTMLGLHEQLRYTAPFRTEPAAFEADIARFFAHSGEVVSGEESADDARTRFGNAVNAVMLANPQERVAVVAHGTVISLLVAWANGLDPLELWRSFGLLDTLTARWPALRLRELSP